MGRKRFNKTSKSLLSKAIKRSNNVYILNINVNDIFAIIDSPTSEAGTILKNFIITCIIMMIMAQITLSARPENAEYVDKLPSYKDIKKKFITSQIGRTLAASAGIASSYPYLMQDPSMQGDENADKVIQIIVDMVDNPSPNIKRIKPSIAEWQRYAKGEAGAAMGQIISCPSTNFKTINISPDIQSFGLSEALASIGINKEILEKYNITPQLIANEIKTTFLIDNSGLPIGKLEYSEPKIITSKIQQEILGEDIIRTGEINTRLVKGLEPDASITKGMIEKYLNSRELIAYRFAINTGDKNILRKYTDLVKIRALGLEEKTD